MESIIQSSKNCFLCGTTQELESHHIFGAANRKLSEKYGLKLWLCAKHHRGNMSAHNNREFDLSLKKIGQTAFEQTYRNLNFLEIFGRNYLDKENDNAKN